MSAPNTLPSYIRRTRALATFNPPSHTYISRRKHGKGETAAALGKCQCWWRRNKHQEVVRHAKTYMYYRVFYLMPDRMIEPRVRAGVRRTRKTPPRAMYTCFEVNVDIRPPTRQKQRAETESGVKRPEQPHPERDPKQEPLFSQRKTTKTNDCCCCCNARFWRRPFLGSAVLPHPARRHRPDHHRPRV